MLKIPMEYNRFLPAKLMDICCQSSSQLCYWMSLLVSARELWWMNQEWLELRWGHTVNQKMATVLGTVCTIPHSNGNQYSVALWTSKISYQLLLLGFVVQSVHSKNSFVKMCYKTQPWNCNYLFTKSSLPANTYFVFLKVWSGFSVHQKYHKWFL
jgi:hypothetical protein